jgi:hypothetical protein
MCILGYFLDPLTRHCSCCSWLPFMPYKPTRENEKEKMLHERWFEQVAQLNPNVRLRDMIIPATHDCGTYGISKLEFFYFAAQTQNLSIYDQLRVGSRSIDLRYGSKGQGREDVYIFHGPYRGPSFKVIFQDLARFSRENPNEFFLVMLQQEKSINEDQKDFLTELIQTYLTPTAVRKEDTTWFDLDKVTASQILQQKKNFFVLADNHFLHMKADHKSQDNTDYPAIGVFSSDSFYQSSWANVNKVSKLWPYELSMIQRMGPMPNTLVCTQTMLTTQATEVDIEDYVIGTESLRLDHFTKDLQKKQNMGEFFLNNMNSQPFNFVELDYIDYNPALVMYLIGLNFPHKLTIVNAYADDINVTQKANSLVSRGRVLYLPNIQTSLGLSSAPKQLKIEFMYEGDSTTTSKTFNCKSIKNQFVLSYVDISKPNK